MWPAEVTIKNRLLRINLLIFFTLGLFLIGWIIDLFIMPMLEDKAERRFQAGEYNYTIAWVLLTFLGVFGIHRFYQGKIGTGLLYLFTLGLCGIGVIYDYWTLNDQLSQRNNERLSYA